MPTIHLKTLPQTEIVPGYFATFVHSANMTSVYWNIKKGAILPLHSHHQEQVATVLEGEFELTIEGEEPARLTPGMTSIIPSNVKHSGVAITECRILDVFYPIRDDYFKFEGYKF